MLTKEAVMAWLQQRQKSLEALSDMESIQRMIGWKALSSDVGCTDKPTNVDNSLDLKSARMLLGLLEP